MAFGFDDVIYAGAAGLAQTGLSALGSLFNTGSSAADALDLWDKMYQPTKLGWSRAGLENQMAIEAYRKQLDSSAKSSLALSETLNKVLPSAQVEGLQRAGLNPILSVLGSGFSPIQASASASSVPQSHSFQQVNRRASPFSAPSAESLFRMAKGAVDAEIDNKEATTDNIKVQNTNLKAQNDLLHSQARKLDAETNYYQDRIDHGNGVVSDYGREIRSGLSPLINSLSEAFFSLLGFGSPDAVKEPVSNSSKSEERQPSLSIVLPDKSSSKKNGDSIYDYEFSPFTRTWIKKRSN